MKLTKTLSIFFLLTFSLLFVNMASAWAPASHAEIANHILDNSQSQIISECQQYRGEFLLGSVTPDITVIYYYSNGGKDYKLTHNWNFADEVMRNAVSPDERCFAYGIGAHLISDSISHNMVVPATIKKTKIPNWITHPLLEQKYDSVRLTKNADLQNISEHMMDSLYGAKGDRYAEMVQKALGTNTNIDVKSDMYKLSYSIGGGSFFESSFKPQGSTLIFKVYPAIAKLTVTLYPIIGNVNSGEVDYYFDRAKELGLNSYANWGSRYQISPHGFDALSEADANANIFTWIYILIAFGVPAGIALWRKSWWYLLLIPALLILEVVIVYTII